MKTTIKKALEDLALHYFEEVAHDPNRTDITVLKGYAENYVNDVEKYLSAYNDFKED